jgi:AraC-like DNA-binding protein
MQAIPLTRRHHLQHFTTTLEENGYSSERMLGRLHMPMWQYGDPNDLIPLRDVLSVLSKLAREVGTEKLGLIVGERNYFHSSTTIGGLILGSPTIYHAMKTACQVASAHTSLAKMWLEEAGDTIWFCRSHFAGLDIGLRQHEQYILTVMIGIVRWGAGPKWKPSEIWLCAPNEPTLEETDVFSDIRIRYGQPHGAISVPKSIACLPTRQRKPSHPLTDEAAIRRCISDAPADDFLGSFRQVISTLLAAGCSHIQCAADITGLHVRTLQRQLEREGVTFMALIDEARFKAATRLFKEPGATMTDIAYNLGYEHACDFSRAFRRWTGVSPSQYRRLH